MLRIHAHRPGTSHPERTPPRRHREEARSETAAWRASAPPALAPLAASIVAKWYQPSLRGFQPVAGVVALYALAWRGRKHGNRGVICTPRSLRLEALRLEALSWQ